MKKVILILLIASTVGLGQQAQFGLKGQLLLSERGLGIGTGLLGSFPLNGTSTIRAIGEFSDISFEHSAATQHPFVKTPGYFVVQIKAQYLYSLSQFYIGAGIAYQYYELSPGGSGSWEDSGIYVSSQELNNTIGADLVAGYRLTNLIGVECSYNFSYPELQSRVSDQGDPEFYDHTQTINLSYFQFSIILTF